MQVVIWHIYNKVVFQLRIFLRALPPARTVLCSARLYSALPKFKKKKFKLHFLLQNVIAVFVFLDSRCKNACKMLADLCPCFHRSPTKLCPDLVSFACWIATEFWSFTRKSVPDLVIRALNCARLYVVCTKLCPNFGCSHARLCPISFVPCPFPNLAGTLKYNLINLSFKNYQSPAHYHIIVKKYKMINIQTTQCHWLIIMNFC